MPAEGKPCEQDWFFGQLQIAGFNTTQLRGVVAEASAGSQASQLSELQKKFPITDAILQSVVGDTSVTLAGAVRDFVRDGTRRDALVTLGGVTTTA